MFRYCREQVLLNQPRLSEADAALLKAWQDAENQYASAQSRFETAVTFEDIDEAILALQTAEARRTFVRAQLRHTDPADASGS